MCAVRTKHKIRQARHQRVRRKIDGTSERPRLSVFKSNLNIYAQIIDDLKNVTLASISTLDKEFKDKLKSGANKEAAKLAGELLAARAKNVGIETVVFDRGGYRYHGRVKELADAARAGGIKF